MALEDLLPDAEDDTDEGDEADKESFPASDAPATNGSRSEGEEPHSEPGGVQVADRRSSVIELTLADGRARPSSITATS